MWLGCTQGRWAVPSSLRHNVPKWGPLDTLCRPLAREILSHNQLNELQLQ